MSKQSTDNVVQNEAAYEYAFKKVPDSKRKGGLSLFVVLAGYPIALSNFVTGAAIGINMTFAQALVVLLVSDAFLIAMAVATGIVAFETGLSTAFLSRTCFGKKGSSIFSILLALSAITWIGINGDTFAKLIKVTFSWWPIPVWLTGIICIALWAQSAIRGYKGLEVVSSFGVPAAIILSIACFIGVGLKGGNGYSTVLSYVPAKQITFTTGCASIIGSWIFGCVITPDVARYAKSRKVVVTSGTLAFFIGLFCLQFIGVLSAMATKNGDFSTATNMLGLGILVFVCAIFCLWTTQDNNIYDASLSLQNVLEGTGLKGKVKHSTIAIIVAAAAAIFSAVGALAYLKPVVVFLSVLMSPVPAMIIAERYFVKNAKTYLEVNPIAIISWLLGGFCGWFCLHINFFVNSVIAFIFTAIVYTALSKAFDKKPSEDSTIINTANQNAANRSALDLKYRG
jgi:cytosine permease